MSLLTGFKIGGIKACLVQTYVDEEITTQTKCQMFPFRISLECYEGFRKNIFPRIADF